MLKLQRSLGLGYTHARTQDSAGLGDSICFNENGHPIWKLESHFQNVN